MHPLKEYLKAVDEPVRDFAARVGASRQTLYRIIAGAQAPKPILARRIVEATGGAVSMDTLYNGGRSGAAIIVIIFSSNVGGVIMAEAALSFWEQADTWIAL